MSVLSLSEAKSFLRMGAPEDDAGLLVMIDAAEAAIANRVGPLEPTVVTVRAIGCSPWLTLPIAPVISLTTVAGADGSTVDPADLYFDSAAGVVSYATSSVRFGASAYDVTYVAGRDACPPALLQAVKELLRHLWQSQRGPRSGVNQSESAGDTVPGAAYLFPFRVEQLLIPYSTPSFA